jgi:hypothetical protein
MNSYQYDLLTRDGFQIHLSMCMDGSSNYLFINDIYNNKLTMKYFLDAEQAKKFIEQLILDE